MDGCRCDERLNVNTEGDKRLTHTGEEGVSLNFVRNFGIDVRSRKEGLSLDRVIS